jgi:hypothetical protein
MPTPTIAALYLLLTIWEGDPGHLSHFGLLVPISSTSLRCYELHKMGAHPGKGLSIFGVIFDVYLWHSEFIFDSSQKGKWLATWPPLQTGCFGPRQQPVKVGLYSRVMNDPFYI